MNIKIVGKQESFCPLHIAFLSPWVWSVLLDLICRTCFFIVIILTLHLGIQFKNLNSPSCQILYPGEQAVLVKYFTLCHDPPESGDTKNFRVD